MISRRYKNEIITYYNQSDWGYKYVWYRGKAWGLHHGLAETTTRSHEEALINQYRLIIKMAGIKRGMRVLDMGCGVGGASIHIAKLTGAKVHGITIVPKQVESARKNAKDYGVEHLVTFEVMDYMKMSFPDNYFDVVFGIESIVYASPMRDFLREARRVTKKIGRLVVVDGYLRHQPFNKTEKKWLKDTLRGWHIQDSLEISEMRKSLQQAGWKVEEVIDKTNAINWSLRRMQIFTWLGKLMPFVPGVVDNVRAMSGWIPGIKAGLFGYFVILAKKR